LTSSSTDRVGPYRIEEALGAGGMGQVYLAYDERLDRRVAIKQIHPDRAGDPQRRARFRREAWAAARLTHPSIVQIYDILESEDGDWIVMELVDGPSLHRLLGDGPVTVADALRWGRQVAEGLAEAHAKGIIHRDLKTENVVISSSGHAKILDFGLAKALWGRAEPVTVSMEGVVVGTCRAMSPEQARGQEIDHRSDLFSLGVMLHEMLSGGSPFAGASAADSLSKVLTFEPPAVRSLNPAVPPGLSNLIQQLLEKDPERRPATTREVAAKLGLLERNPEAAGDATVAFGPARGGAGGGRAGAPDPIGRRSAAGVGGAATSPAAVEPAAGAPRLARRRARRRWVLAAAAALGVAALLAAWLVAGGRWGPPRRLGGGNPGGAGSEVRGPAAGSHELLRRATELLRRYDRVGNLDQAVDLLQQALAQDEDSAALHAGLARAFWLKYFSESKDRSWLDRALPVAERAVSLDGHLAAARISRGTVYAAVGRYDEAERDFGYVLILDPGNADAYRGRGEVAELRGDFGAAEEAFRKAVALRPDDRDLLDRLGQLYYKLGRYADAESAYRSSIEAAPDSPFGYRNLAAAFYMQGRKAEAAGQLQQALAIRPEASTYRNLGVILFSQGLYQEAATAFDKALAFPEGVNDYVYWANLGDAQRWLPGREDEARRAYLRALQLLRPQLDERPDDATLLSRQALYLAKRGECDRAAGDLERLGALAAADASSLYRAAVAYEVCGRRERALAALGEALAAGFSAVEVRSDPELLRLREDPRYHRLAMDYESAS
jgi:serine/threonine-protein kinase